MPRLAMPHGRKGWLRQPHSGLSGAQTFVAPLVLVATCAARFALASDRIVEFSSRTLPRLDQLLPAPVPTTLIRRGGGGGDGSSPAAAAHVAEAPVWSLSAADNTLRPAANADLCLAVLHSAPQVGSPVALFPCAGANASARHTQRSRRPPTPPPTPPPQQQWRWNAASAELSVATDPTLCVTRTPIGIEHTLSLALCRGRSGDGGGGTGGAGRAGDGAGGGAGAGSGGGGDGGGGGDNNTQWEFTPSGSPLLSAHGSAVVALYPDSVHSGVRDLLQRLAPVFNGAGAGDTQLLMGCFGWMIDLAIGFTGHSTQQLPTVNPESPQWSTGNATYVDPPPHVSTSTLFHHVPLCYTRFSGRSCALPHHPFVSSDVIGNVALCCVHWLLKFECETHTLSI
jgi:hypothetical protein